jgi:hypothetical protein
MPEQLVEINDENQNPHPVPTNIERKEWGTLSYFRLYFWFRRALPWRDSRGGCPYASIYTRP